VEGGLPIALVMLDKVAFPSDGVLMAAIRRRVPGFSNAFPDVRDDPAGLIGDVDGKRCIVAFYDQPNPLEPDHSCIKSAWWWRNAWDCLQQRKAHIVVCMIHEDEPVHRYGIIARLAAAVIDTSPAIGVLWELADAVWPADEFRDEVNRSGTEPPVRMCVSVKLAGDAVYPHPSGGPAYSGLTWGLAAFDLMEIEVRGYGGKPAELAMMMLNMAAYLIACGPVVEDGQTVGYEGQQKFMVHREPSTIAPGLTVYRLYLS
jgi:hypothetical protein